MSNPVFGFNNILSVKIDDTYIPVLCAVTSVFKAEQEILRKTGPNSPGFREKLARLSDWTCTLSGLTKIENDDTVSFFYMLQQSVRTAKQSIKLTFTDEDNNSKEITGDVFMSVNQIGGNAQEFFNCEIDFEGTGAFSMETVPAPSGDFDVLSDYWNTVNGQNYISGTSAEEGYTLTSTDVPILVIVEGTEFDLVGGSPGSRQAQFVTSPSIKMQFSSDMIFDGSQKVTIVFKRPL